jgi:hypothetical protein
MKKEVERMNDLDHKQLTVLTNNGIALVAIQFVRILLGGYTIGLDQFHYADLDSALTVLVLYGVITILTIFFLLGRRKIAIYGLIGISAFFFVMESIYMIVYFTQTTIDPSFHDPLFLPWLTALKFVLPLLTIVFAILVNREAQETG